MTTPIIDTETNTPPPQTEAAPAPAEPSAAPAEPSAAPAEPDQAESGSSPKLTPREVETLRRMAEGETGIRIAEAMGISVKTVEAHRSRIFRKLGASNAPHAVALGFRTGLLA